MTTPPDVTQALADYYAEVFATLYELPVPNPDPLATFTGNVNADPRQSLADIIAHFAGNPLTGQESAEYVEWYNGAVKALEYLRRMMGLSH